MIYSLRAYQDLGINLTREALIQGYRRILLFLATGGGKGLVMSKINHDALKNGKKVLTVMRRREIIFQTVNNYKKYHNVNASPIMSGARGFDKINPCQVCSIDTIRARMKTGDVDFLKEFDIVIVDECHDTNSDTYQEFFEFLGDKIYLGFTATPFTIGKKRLKFWQKSVKPIEPKELRDQGYLCRVKPYAPFVIDTSNIGIRKGEFDSKELFKRVSENAIVGSIVDNYIKYGKDLPAILFATNKMHSSMMAEAFRMKGIPAIHMDESHNSKERQIAIDDLRTGKIKVLCNVNIFSTGVDIPEACVGIMARPTMSEILWIQQVGRLLRPHPGKTHAIILDHAGNTDRHGGAFIVRHAALEAEALKPTIDRLQSFKCPKCYFIHEAPIPPKCDDCGYVFIVKKSSNSERSMPDEIEGVLMEIEEDEHPIIEKHRELMKEAKEKKWKKMAPWFRLYEEFGDEIYLRLKVPFWAKEILTKRNLNATATTTTSRLSSDW